MKWNNISNQMWVSYCWRQRILCNAGACSHRNPIAHLGRTRRFPQFPHSPGDFSVEKISLGVYNNILRLARSKLGQTTTPNTRNCYKITRECVWLSFLQSERVQSERVHIMRVNPNPPPFPKCRLRPIESQWAKVFTCPKCTLRGWIGIHPSSNLFRLLAISGKMDEHILAWKDGGGGNKG